MANIKLKEFCEQNSISYITGYRWFRDGQIPGAYKTDSGTILIPQDFKPEQSDHVMSAILKKVVEFSKNDGTVEDFAAWILSTFSLKLNSVNEKPSYSRNKPKPEEVQKHFQQFIKSQGEKPKPSMFVAPAELIEETAERQGWRSLSEEETQKTAAKVDASKIDIVNATDIPELNQSINDLFSFNHNNAEVGAISAGGDITRSLDLAPQLNYTLTSNAAFSANSLMPNTTVSTCFDNAGTEIHTNVIGDLYSFKNTFGPTQKELQSTTKVLEVAEKPRRGRKPSKITK
jgi:hypothetical protein